MRSGKSDRNKNTSKFISLILRHKPESVSTAGIVLAVGCLGGIPLLVIAYNRIYRKYKRRGI